MRICRLIMTSRGTGGAGKRTHILHGAKRNPISFAEGSVNGSGFGNAHFSSLNQGRNIGGISIAITDEAPGEAAFIDDSFENPTTGREIRKFILEIRLDSATTPPGS